MVFYNKTVVFFNILVGYSFRRHGRLFRRNIDFNKEARKMMLSKMRLELEENKKIRDFDEGRGDY